MANSNSSSSPPTVVSCPGKVLLAGGYLVLDPNQNGLVVATPSRFYTVVREEEQQPEQVIQDSEDHFRVRVSSPQFDDGQWKYEAKRTDSEWVVTAVESEGSSSNTFVHLSVQAALQSAVALSPSTSFRSLAVTIVGSNDFYSQSRSDSDPIPFAPLNCTIRNVHKTGLGSSAAMVTSLTSGLVLHWTTPSSFSPSSPDRFPNPDEKTIQLLHNLAQYVHSLAQGKVGSGFDVSAAVFGSQVYKRFAVECLEDLLDPTSSRGSKITSSALHSVLSPSQNLAWTTSPTAGSVAPFSLPPYTLLLLADVDAGSNTPSMVGKVLNWKKAQPEDAERVWRELGESNGRVGEAMAVMKAQYASSKEAYEEDVRSASTQTVGSWSASSAFSETAERILETRALMRYMGDASGVPIEPPEQKKLLDACSALPGVIGAGVPGAGGYDAIWVLCLSPPPASSSSPDLAPVAAVDALLRSYTEMSVRPLSKHAWVKGGTEEGEKGLLRVRVEDVEGLKEAIERSRQ